MATGGKDLDQATDQPTTTQHPQKANGNFPTGYECEFVEPPPHVLPTECSICLHIPREPHQVSCCGQHFCKSCVEQAQSENKPCSLCNQPDFAATLDKSVQRHLNALKVYCTHKEQGCEWMGELRELDHHLNANPKSGEELTGCEFVELSCIHGCGGRFQRHSLNDHCNSCPSRPFSCEYCSHSSTYQDVVDHHWSECPQYPLQCPNSCDSSCIERQHLEDHLHKECPLEKVNCEFQFAGCVAQVQHKDMATHVKDNLPQHTTQLACTTRILAADIRDEIKQKFDHQKKQTTTLKDQVEKRLQENEEVVKQEQAEVKTRQKDLERKLQELKAASDNTQTILQHTKTSLNSNNARLKQYSMILAATIIALVAVFAAVIIMQHQQIEQLRHDHTEAAELIQQLQHNHIKATEQLQHMRQDHIEATELIQQLRQYHTNTTEQMRQYHTNTTEQMRQYRIEATEQIQQLRQGHIEATEKLSDGLQHLQYELHHAPVLVSPSMCTAEGPGLHSSTVNITTEFTVSLVNILGLEYSGKCVNVTTQLESDGSFTSAKASYMEASKYHVTFTSRVRGWNTLYVKVNNNDINGSPFNIFVSPKNLQEIGGLNQPWGIAINSHGEIFVAEYSAHQISVFDTNRQKIRTIRNGKFVHPAGIDIDTDDNVYVASHQKLQKFNRNGEHVKSVESSTIITGARVHNNKLYVCDRDNYRVLVYDLELTIIGQYGTGEGEFDKPYDIDFDAKGNAYVVDSGNKRVQVLNENGQFQQEFGREKLNDPRGIHIAGDYVYVSLSSKVVVFRTSGDFVTTIGENFGTVYGITTDSNETLYVCKYDQNRCIIL